MITAAYIEDYFNNSNRTECYSEFMRNLYGYPEEYTKNEMNQMIETFLEGL